VRRRSQLFVLAAAGGAVALVRRRRAAAARVAVFHQDGSMLVLDQHAPQAVRMLAVARDALRAARPA
jgi:hypothetical protein